VCPRYLIADAQPTRVGDVDIIRLSGDIPNTHANGSLIRSEGAGLSSVRARFAYGNAAGGTYTSGTAVLPAYSDQRIRVDAPNTIRQGGALTVKAVAERFDRAWVPNAATLQLQFAPDGGSYSGVGSAVATGQDGNAVFNVPAVGDAGNWRVVTTAPPGGRTVASPAVHVGFAAAPPATPSAPLVTLANASTTALLFNVDAPAVGAPITSYRWTWTGGGRTRSAVVPAGSQGATYRIGGLRPGTVYAVTAQAVNASGPGEVTRLAGRTKRVAPAVNPPGPPRVAGSAGNHRVTIRWTTPRAGGARIDRYQVHRYRANRFVGPRVHRVTFGGLANNRTYTLFVRAHNKAGWGAWSRGVPLRPHR